MRIIAGELRGRRLRAPRGAATRPTADRVKESLFSILGPPPGDALDLFAGSGALGLESLSRGAPRVVLVDSARDAAACMAQNVADLGVGERAEILCLAVATALPRLRAAGRSFGWVFLDPPYASPDTDAALAALGDDLLAPGGVVIVEHDRRRPPQTALPLKDRRRYGDTELSFYLSSRAPERDDRRS